MNGMINNHSMAQLRAWSDLTNHERMDGSVDSGFIMSCLP